MGAHGEGFARAELGFLNGKEALLSKFCPDFGEICAILFLANVYDECFACIDVWKGRKYGEN